MNQQRKNIINRNTMKFTTEQAMENEYISLAEALGHELELNADFIDRYVEGERTRKLLLSIPEDCRADAIKHAEVSHTFPDFVIEAHEGDICLPCDEIEVQFEGKPEDYFEESDEWTIYGNLAYLYVGHGLLIQMDVEKLAEYTRVL